MGNHKSHILYVDSDFTSEEIDRNNRIADLVINGGLAICKQCGKAEAELVKWCPKAKVIERVVDRIDGTACEIEYTSEDGEVVGYWAYGSFDPEGLYQG